MGALSVEEKKSRGASINLAKQAIEAALTARRKALADQTPITLTCLAHAALIAYPRYYDPITRRPCPPEVAVDRLINGPIPRLGAAHRTLAKLQGQFASFAYLWR